MLVLQFFSFLCSPQPSFLFNNQLFLCRLQIFRIKMEQLNTTEILTEKEPCLETDSSLNRSQGPSPSQCHTDRFTKKRIGPYCYYLKDQIGSGFSSTVYRGFKNNDKTDVVAMKVVRLDNMKPHLRHLLQNEVKTLKEMDHPNILKFIDIYYTKNNYYIITQYCQGGSLQTAIDTRTQFNWKQAAYQVGLACQYLAQRQIIHRDIKPANVLIKNNTFKLSDFGFTASFETQDRLKQNYLIGSPLYMPIEALVDHVYSSKSDSFALGVFIYYLATRSYPWKGKNKTELVASYKRRSYHKTAVGGLPPRVKHLLNGLLQVDPVKRMHVSQCDFQVFTHLGPLTNFNDQLEFLKDKYTEQLNLCQYIDSLYHNYSSYQHVNTYLPNFLSRHLASITTKFNWDKQRGLRSLKANYILPQQDTPFGSDDYFWLNNCLKDTIRVLLTKGLAAMVMVQKLLRYQQVIEAILFGPKQNVVDRIAEFVIHSDYTLVRPNNSYIKQTLAQIDFYQL